MFGVVSYRLALLLGAEQDGVLEQARPFSCLVWLKQHTLQELLEFS
jgi:hypothetical protein